MVQIHPRAGHHPGDQQPPRASDLAGHFGRNNIKIPEPIIAPTTSITESINLGHERSYGVRVKVVPDLRASELIGQKGHLIVENWV